MLVLFILLKGNKDFVKNEVQNCFKIFKNPIIQYCKVKKITQSVNWQTIFNDFTEGVHPNY